MTTRPALPRPILAALLLAAVGSGSACSVCEAHSDCAGADLCIEGACVEGPAATATVVLPSGPVGDTFDVALELRFRGGEAVVSVERSLEAPGEPCLPLPPISRRVEGDVDDLVTRVVVLPGIPSLGRTFTLDVRVEVNGRTIFVKVPVEGPEPPPGLGGITLVRPRRAEVDAIVEARLDIEVEARGQVRAWIEPLPPSLAPETPKAFLIDEGQTSVGQVPIVRGPQILWVEAINGDTTNLCGHAFVGGPAEVEDGEFEILLHSQSADGDDHLVELSTRVTDGGEVAFCDGRGVSTVPCRSRVRATTAATSVDGLILGLDRGVIEVAAVPRMTSGPVSVQVRVSRGQQHLGFFGPLTLQPARGETWVAGRIVLDDDGVAVVTPGVQPPSPGLPW